MSWLSEESVVRDCVTENIIGHLPKSNNTREPFAEIEYHPKLMDTTETRQEAFIEIFNNRTWIRKDRGKDTYFFIPLGSLPVQNRKGTDLFSIAFQLRLFGEMENQLFGVNFSSFLQ